MIPADKPPVNFNTEHKNMLSNLHVVVSKGYLAVDPKYDKLIVSLRLLSSRSKV